LVTVPGTIPANVAALYGDTVAVEARGFDGYPLWARNAVPLLGFLSAKAVLRHLAVEASVQPAILVSVNSTSSRTAMLSSISAGYVHDCVTAGLRAQLYVASEPLARNDFSQFAVVPYARLDRDTFFFRLEWALNLDGPYGIAGSRGATVWGAAATAGVVFK
jgi:hypothetical protein